MDDVFALITMDVADAIINVVDEVMQYVLKVVSVDTDVAKDATNATDVASATSGDDDYCVAFLVQKEASESILQIHPVNQKQVYRFHPLPRDDGHL